MLQRIIRIENAGPNLRARRIFFEDDTDFRTTAAAVVKKLGIVEGLEIERSALEESLAAEELPLAKERALQLIGYRERSSQELHSKLKDSGFPAHVAAAVVSRYTEVELVDDDRFTAAWIRSRRASGYGNRRIRRELEEKGIDPSIALSALEADADQSEIERAIDSLRGRRPRDRADYQRMIKRLLTRGFSVSSARSAIEQLATRDDEDSDAPNDGDTIDDLQ